MGQYEADMKYVLSCMAVVTHDGTLSMFLIPATSYLTKKQDKAQLLYSTELFYPTPCAISLHKVKAQV